MKAYTIVFEWSTEDCEDTEVVIFDSYKKALACLNDIIEKEKTPGMSWVADAFDENGNLDEKNYELDCSDFTDDQEHELWWNIQKCDDWYYHNHLELRILEVK